MKRFWPVDYMDGWTASIEEEENGSLRIIVVSDTGRSWSTTRDTINDAVDLAWRIVAEQRPISFIINPALDYLDYECQ